MNIRNDRRQRALTLSTLSLALMCAIAAPARAGDTCITVYSEILDKFFDSDSNSTGTNSFACGKQNEAQGNESVAMGRRCWPWSGSWPPSRRSRRP